jgi:predicted RNA-binding Zn-ribbon protein involved in translation (DUF1610 family)
MATARRLKINKRYATSACAWCGDSLALGDEGAICEACESPHHARCWDKENGCNGAPDCVNRPLRQLPDGPPPAKETTRPLRFGESVCPSCGDIVAGFCYRCSQMGVSSEPYIGVRETAETAKEALKYAIAGFLCCQIFGVMAVIKGIEAKKEIARNPRLKGEGLATVALVLGVIEFLLGAIWILGIFAGTGK